MKNQKMLFKVITIILTLVLTAALVAIPASADNPGIEVKDYNGNAIIRTVANSLVALLAVVGILFGGWQLAQGFIAQDHKERMQGIITIVGSLLLGALILVILNMVLK